MPEEIVQQRPLAGPFEGCELSGLGDRLPIADEAPVVILLITLDRLGDEVLFLCRRELAALDEIEIPLGVLQDLIIR